MLNIFFLCIVFSYAVPGDSANLRAKCSPNMEYLDYVMNDDLIYKDRQRLGTGKKNNII